MAATASPWVPVAAAAVGAGAVLIVGILTQLWADHREKKRWQREREDRQEQWRREREDRQVQWEREDSLRWLQDRQQAYARFVAALFEWDARLSKARVACKYDAEFGTRTKLDTAEIAGTRMAARQDLTLVQFMAPEEIRSLARSAVTFREAFLMVHLDVDEVNVAELDAAWNQLSTSMTALLKAMRNDLRIEIAVEDTDTAHASDEVAQLKISSGESTPQLAPDGTGGNDKRGMDGT